MVVSCREFHRNRWTLASLFEAVLWQPGTLGTPVWLNLTGAIKSRELVFFITQGRLLPIRKVSGNPRSGSSGSLTINWDRSTNEHNGDNSNSFLQEIWACPGLDRPLSVDLNFESMGKSFRTKKTAHWNSKAWLMSAQLADEN